jgi:hypothetical protein
LYACGMRHAFHWSMFLEYVLLVLLEKKLK